MFPKPIPWDGPPEGNSTNVGSLKENPAIPIRVRVLRLHMLNLMSRSVTGECMTLSVQMANSPEEGPNALKVKHHNYYGHHGFFEQWTSGIIK